MKSPTVTPPLFSARKTLIKTTFSAVAFTAAEPEVKKKGEGKGKAGAKGKAKPKPKAKPAGGGHSVPE